MEHLWGLRVDARGQARRSLLPCPQARWDVKAVSSAACSISISVEVPFSKKTMLKGRIEQGALDESHETDEAWMKQVTPPCSMHLPSRSDGSSTKAADIKLTPGRSLSEQLMG